MKNKKFLSFDLDNRNVKIRNILNQDFLSLELYMIADHNPNNNFSHFTLESMQDALPSIHNKPILAAFSKLPNEQDGDFMGHESEYKEDEETEAGYFDNSGYQQEVPIGLITESSKVEIVKGEDGANWIKANGYLWVKYCTPQVLSLLRRHKGHCKISVEVEVLESEEDENTNVEHIQKFDFLGVTILGSYPVQNAELLGINARQEIHEGIEGARLRVLDFTKKPDFQNKIKQLSFACKQLEESLNSNNSLTNQNNKTESLSEEDIYHTNHPKDPENEGWEEIAFDDDSSEDGNEDSNGNANKSDNSKKDPSRKEEKSQMNFSLSYNTRRELLDSALHEAVHGMYAGDNIWCYVNDFDDSVCYFYLEVEGADCGDWCAPYTLTLGSENGEDKVIDCTINLTDKERVVREWKKLSKDEDSETEGKADMNKDNYNDKEKQEESQNFDDRGTEASKSGDSRAVPAGKSGDDRGVPHPPATYTDEPEDDKKETEACDDKENEACKEDEAKDDKSEECKMSDDSKDSDDKDSKKENEACGDKENEACKDKEDEACKEDEAKNVTEVRSTPAGGKSVTHVPSRSVNDCDCDDDDDSHKEDHACDKDEECNYEAKFAQLSKDYVAMQKENETLKAVNAKFESDIADLIAKVNKFEAEKNEAVNANLYNFGLNLINAETDINEDTRKAMSAELETECKASKFASEDDVERFTVTKIAMALYEARKAQKENMSQKNGKKEEFVQNIVKNDNVGSCVDELTAKRNALEALD